MKQPVRLKIGQSVSVKVSKPKYGWGHVTKKSVGFIAGRRTIDGSYIVNFPENKNFLAAPGELKPAPYVRTKAPRKKLLQRGMEII